MSDLEYLERIMIAVERQASDLAIVKQALAKVVNYMVDAETEVSEKMRRFIMYMHDIHDIKNLYDEHGIEVPDHVMREMERCDDRLRQLLTEAHAAGGTFEKVRREMAKDKDNRWDHAKQLAYVKSKENGQDENAGQSRPDSP